jgi:hypothetical protein
LNFKIHRSFSLSGASPPAASPVIRSLAVDAHLTKIAVGLKSNEVSQKGEREWG